MSVEQETHAEAKIGGAESLVRSTRHGVWNYVEVMKPRETALLTFVGMCAAIVAGLGHPSWGRLTLTVLAILMGSAGCNGLTNYLDRDMDARLERTRRRAIPSGRIKPPEKMLPLAIGLVGGGLVLAFYLNPLAFLFGLAGTVVALIARKRSITHVPLGEISSCAPVLVGWLGVNPELNWTLFFLCAIVFFWTPIHVWSLMTAYREDYRQAGVCIFPLPLGVGTTSKLLLLLSFFLYGSSLGPYFTGAFGGLYLLAANVLGLVMIAANAYLLRTGASRDAWKVYKLSAYPYLGLIFTLMCLDLWMRY
ncbi:MAG: protoheme IX farnesyltransferase [Anaerolineae bacterium]